MKKNVKKLGALLLAGAMAVSTVGCMPTSKPQESTGEQNAQASDATQGTEEPAAPEGLEVDTQTPITLRLNWWGGDSRNQATLAAIDKFQEKYPNIKVAAEYEAFNGHEEKIALGIKSGNAADVMQLDWSWVSTYSPKGDNFYDLNKVFNILDLDNYTEGDKSVFTINGKLNAPAAPKIGVAKPKVIIPVFPGTNCEYDTAKAFARAGADPEILVIRNLTPADVTASCEALVKAIGESQIVMLPGGFSGGDEPDGSAKFIASFFRSPAVTEAVRDLLQHRDGLMLGICNGFQALIKLGLVPYGKIVNIQENDPTLTFNTIGRHISQMAYTRVTSTKSPWLAGTQAGDMFAVPISHGEGRFVADEATLRRLAENGQIATQYVDPDGNVATDMPFNPNGSVWAVEGITSPDGRVLGKMGHCERKGENLYKNVPFNKDMQIFESGVKYFK